MGSEPGHDAGKAALPAEIGALMRQAMAFHRAGMLAEAAPFYSQILDRQPDHRDALHFLGVLSHQQGDDTTAVTLIDRALALDDGDPALHANLGIALKGCGQLDAAIDAYRRAIALAPGFPEAHNNLGIALYQQGKVDAAVSHYRAALGHRLAYADAHFNLAVALRKQGAPEEALAAYQRALDCRAQYPEALHGLASIQLELKRFDEAAAAYQRYLAERPDDLDAIKALGVLLTMLRRNDEALAVYGAGLKKHPEDSEILNNLGIALMAEARVAEAGAAFRAAVEHKPDFADAQYNEGIVLERTGRMDEAAAAFEATLRLQPRHPQAHQALGALYSVLGRSEDVARIYRHWRDVAPDHPAARHMAAAVSAAEMPVRATDDYIRTLFAPFAPAFDAVLANLNYRVPGLLAALLARFPADRPLDIADAGCGTGLCAPVLRPLARRLVGVDLSPEMLEKARARGLYDALVEAELTAFLRQNAAAFDLIVVADTLVYFGDLAMPLGAAAGALRQAGRIAFNLERDTEDHPAGYRLNQYGRYVHDEDHVRRRLAEAGFTILSLETTTIREQALEPVQGLLVLATK
ncbi:MAG TPA: tetratricopeptide repeat protein [Stellaceae bacterium]